MPRSAQGYYNGFIPSGANRQKSLKLWIYIQKSTLSLVITDAIRAYCGYEREVNS